MKFILILLMLPCLAFSQRYLNVEGGALVDGEYFLGGPIASVGGIIKNKDGKDLFMLGGETGVLFDEGEPFGVPLFAEFGYINKRKKVFPQAIARVGTLLYDDLYADFYSTIRIGLACQIGGTRVTPFVGLTIITDYGNVLPTFGVAVIFLKRNN